MEPNPGAGMSDLEVRGVHKSFGGLMALHDVNLRVPAGELRALIGPNGAGKTTLMNVITGRYAPDKGSIRLGETEIAGLPPHRIARLGVARTMQITSIFPGLTVYENLWLAVASRRRIKSPWVSARRWRSEDHKTRELLAFLGLETKTDQPASELAYGEQRLLEVGLALARDPRVLLLDEPAAGLSAREVAVVVEKIRELAPGRTILLIEHDMDLVMSLADRITVLHYGKVLAEGVPDEIRANEEVQRVYLGGWRPC